MAKATIAASYARALLDLAVEKGASRPLLIQRSHIDPVDLEDQDNRIPLTDYLALLKAGEELLDEPALSLQFGEAFSMPELSIVGLIGQSAETVGEAFVQLNRYVRLMIDADEGSGTDWFDLIRDNGGAWMTLTSNIYIKYPQLAESAFARCVSASAHGSDAKPFAKAVHFTHAEPIYRAEYDRIFGVPLVFGSDKNAILVDGDFLSTTIAPANHYAFGVFSERADTLLKRLEKSKTMKGQVQSLLIPILHTGETSMEQIAKKMGLSRRTLYRKLNTEGVHYKKLLDDLRHQMALHYLNGEKVSVSETAYLVGYSDASAFSRAFKRWTGASPRGAHQIRA